MHDNFEALVLDRLLDQTGIAAVLKEQVTALREELSLAERALLAHTTKIKSLEDVIVIHKRQRDEHSKVHEAFLDYRKKQENACASLFAAAERLTDAIRETTKFANTPKGTRLIQNRAAVRDAMRAAYEYCGQIPF